MQQFDRYLFEKYQKEIEEIYIGDTEPLFDGTITLKNAINRNINSYLEKDVIVSSGVKVSVIVVTRLGMILYPDTFEEKSSDLHSENPIEIAAENYSILNEGLNLKIDAGLDHNTLPTNLLLFVLIFSSSIILYVHYSSGKRKALHDVGEAVKEIERLKSMEHESAGRMDAITRERETLAAKVLDTKKNLEEEKEKSERNEEDLIEEIVALEEKLNINFSLQQNQQKLIDELKDKLANLEKPLKDGSKEQRKSYDAAGRRFKALYKNTVFHEKAINGYGKLSDEFKLKCEETIHRLNEDAEKVPVKRKVFGKKNRKTSFEVGFGYKGRLYFRYLHSNKAEVLLIGTKNTQRKDLEFLDKL